MILTDNILNVTKIFFIINISGKQKVFFDNEFFDILFIRNTNFGDIIKLNRILFIYIKRGVFTSFYLGKPFIDKINIFAIIIQHFLTRKIIILKYKRKKNYLKKNYYKTKKTRVFIPKKYFINNYGT